MWKKKGWTVWITCGMCWKSSFLLRKNQTERDTDMKKSMLAIMVAAVLLILAACGGTNQDSASKSRSEALPPIQQPESSSAEPDVSEVLTAETAITLTVGDHTFPATLLDNETARQLAELFPLTLDMSELNGNEKYFYLDGSLPTDSCQPGQINVGDLMLYGDNCLVLFYDSFSSGYSYTRLGNVDDPVGLAEALGAGNVEVTFSARDDG